ncbi:MAG: TonB-dependent receptor [Bryobacteraceae bacterium]|nr:TonB-dependent receptor [Bryobacteraceae bacterium]
MNFPRNRALLWASLFLPCALLAQDATGRIVGTVQDPQGAMIASAKVTVTNAGTNITRETQTGNDGAFQVLLLQPGRYTLTVEAPGFRKTVTDPQTLEINQSLRFDIKLDLGQTSETVQVEARPSGVETINATLGNVISSRPVVNMPLNGRNVLDLALLSPGVNPGRPGGVLAPNATTAGRPNISGGRSDSTTYILDGGMNNNTLNNDVVYNPNPDAIQEFKVLVSNYTAEYGRNGGGIISVVTKSGTNQYHGSGFWFHRNDFFNANRFFNNANGVPREVLKRNQYGATLGGPLSIPKVFDAKDKLFFFFAYQGQKLRNLQSSREVRTFTPAELTGDFSRSGPGGTADPSVAAFLRANPFFQSNPALAAQGIIDPARINPVARNYISNGLMPVSATGRITPQGSLTNDYDEYTGKVDFTPTNSDRFSVTLGVREGDQLNPFSYTAFYADTGGFPTTTKSPRRFANVNYTRTFTPNLINDFRFTVQRSVTNQQIPAREAPTPQQLGVNVTPDRASGPSILFFDNTGLSAGFNNNGPADLINNTYIYQNTVSWQKGRHTMRMGGYFSAYQNNTLYDFYVNGAFFFASPAAGGIGSANDRANFLFGLPYEYLQFPSAPSNIRSKNVYGFFQDEWRVMRNLVLTFGIRYEYAEPKFDTEGRSFSLVEGQRSQRFPNAPRGMLFPGDSGAPKGANFPDKNDWAPRFGFAYSPNSKMSVRGGFGVFHDILKGEDNLQFNGQAPFFGFADLFFDELPQYTGVSNYFSNPFVAAGIPNSFPSRPPTSSLDFAAAGFLPVGGTGVYYVNPRLRTPYLMQYNISIQRELVKDLVMEVAYVGSQGRKLTSLVDANPMLLGTNRRRLNMLPGNTDTSFSFIDQFENIGTSNYNALQASVTKRLSDTRFFGTSYFTLAYTWSKSIDNSSGFRDRGSRVPAYNPGQFRAVSDFDLTHNLVFSGGWDLPIDRAWASAPKLLTRGWSLYPIFTWRTGFPVDVFANIARSRTRPGPSGAGDANQVRTNQVLPEIAVYDPRNRQTIQGRTGNFWFDPRAFSNAGLITNNDVPAPNQRTYGTLGRNAFRAAGRTNFDLAIAKSLFFGERFKAELRGEAFNLANNAQWLAPNTTFGNPLFGMVTTTLDPRILQVALRLSF